MSNKIYSIYSDVLRYVRATITDLVNDGEEFAVPTISSQIPEYDGSWCKVSSDIGETKVDKAIYYLAKVLTDEYFEDAPWPNRFAESYSIDNYINDDGTDILALKQYEKDQYEKAFEVDTDDAWNRYLVNVKRAVSKYNKNHYDKVDIDMLTCGDE